MKKATKRPRKWVAWNPETITLNALGTGLIIIALSVGMGRFAPGSGMAIFIRDFLMILAAGIFWPLHCMKTEGDYEGFEFSPKSAFILLPVNAFLAAALLVVFLGNVPVPAGFAPVNHMGEILYIMLAGIFETIVFFTFIRKAFERSFGVVAGIIAAAAFYSLHHAGFQIEFAKLFAVGLLYATTVAIADNPLIIWPFFWGIGATWDVLIQSEAVSKIHNPWSRSAVLFAGMILAAAILALTRSGKRVIEGGAILDEEGFTTEEYGKRMKKQLEGEYRRFAKNAERSLNLRSGGRVLEIGPGPGWAGIELLKRRDDISLTAIEASPDMIRAAVKNAQEEGCGNRVEYCEGIVEDLSRFGNGEFDAVISRDSLHHWTDPGKAFLEIDRVLMKNGTLFIVDSKRNLGLAEWLIVHVFGTKFAGDMITGWKNSIKASYTPKELREIFSTIGLGQWQVHPAFLDLVITRKTL